MLLPFAVAFNHITRTLCMWATMEAMLRPLPSGGSARHASAGRLSIRYRLMRSLISKAFNRAPHKLNGAEAVFGMMVSAAEGANSLAGLRPSYCVPWPFLLIYTAAWVVSYAVHSPTIRNHRGTFNQNNRGGSSR